MSPHVQAWFTMPFNAAQVTAAKELLTSVTGRNEPLNFDDFTQGEFDAITGLLKGEFVVEVRRSGHSVRIPDESPIYMRVHFTSAIGEQIQRWITDQSTFDPAQVQVADTEVLVKVRAECCGLTSSGHACACK